MLSLPVPVVVALLLMLLATSHQRLLRDTPTGQLMLLAIYALAISMLAIGLRWSLDALWLMRIAATASIASTVFLYLAFRSLERPLDPSLRRDGRHGIVVALTALVALSAPAWLDWVLVPFKCGYAFLLIRQARKAPSSLQHTKLTWLEHTVRAMWLAAAFLLAGAVIDVVVTLDFILNDGRYAPTIVALVNLLSVFFVGWIAVQAGLGSTNYEASPTLAAALETKRPDRSSAHARTSDDDQALLATLNQLLVDEKLFADENLNLAKLARKVGEPTRSISRVINATTQQNVSQWVNAARIREACALLLNSELSVTDVMHQVGFATKSNFNREFKRATGSSPRTWRATHRPSDPHDT